MLRKKLKINNKAPKLRVINCVIYALFVVLLASLVIHVFGLKSLHKSFFNTVQFLELDILYYKFLDLIKIDLELGKLVILQKWLWLAAYFGAAYIIGAVHTYIYARRLDFRQIFLTCALIAVFKLLAFSIPYHVFPVFVYFIDFVKKFYPEPVMLLIPSFFGLFLGTELFILWIKNTDGRELMDRYGIKAGKHY